MPIVTPETTVSTMAQRVSWSVAGRRSRTTTRAGVRYWNDWPKSPRKTLLTKIAYWTWSGSFSPS
jgi:hypothetical protein